MNQTLRTLKLFSELMCGRLGNDRSLVGRAIRVIRVALFIYGMIVIATPPFLLLALDLEIATGSARNICEDLAGVFQSLVKTAVLGILMSSSIGIYIKSRRSLRSIGERFRG